MTDQEALHQAYIEIGGGRPFVLIWEIRQKLGWDRDRFDSVLAELAKDSVLELTSGDPTDMTDQQIEDSYIDGLGYQLFCVCWY